MIWAFIWMAIGVSMGFKKNSKISPLFLLLLSFFLFTPFYLPIQFSFNFFLSIFFFYVFLLFFSYLISLVASPFPPSSSFSKNQKNIVVFCLIEYDNKFKLLIMMFFFLCKSSKKLWFSLVSIVASPHPTFDLQLHTSEKLYLPLHLWWWQFGGKKICHHFLFLKEQQ